MKVRSIPGDSQIINIALAYDEGDDIEEIENSLVERTEAGLPRLGPVADHASLILAGGISYRLLASGLIKWASGLEGVSIYVEVSSKSGTIAKIFKGRTPGDSGIVITSSGGKEARHGTDADPQDLADDIEDASA